MVNVQIKAWKVRLTPRRAQSSLGLGALVKAASAVPCAHRSGNLGKPKWQRQLCLYSGITLPYPQWAFGPVRQASRSLDKSYDDRPWKWPCYFMCHSSTLWLMLADLTLTSTYGHHPIRYGGGGAWLIQPSVPTSAGWTASHLSYSAPMYLDEPVFPLSFQPQADLSLDRVVLSLLWWVEGKLNKPQALVLALT